MKYVNGHVFFSPIFAEEQKDSIQEIKRSVHVFFISLQTIKRRLFAVSLVDFDYKEINMAASARPSNQLVTDLTKNDKRFVFFHISIQ